VDQQTAKNRPAHASAPTWRALATEALLSALIAWFAIVAVTALPGLRPRQVQTWGIFSQESYLDDFAVFYSAGRLFTQGQGKQVYRLEALTAEEAKAFGQSPSDFVPLPFFNPPLALLLFGAFSALSLAHAVLLWTAGTLLLAGLGFILLWRAYPRTLTRSQSVAVALGLISSLPFYQTALHGQIAFLLLFGVCLLYAAIRRPSPKLSVPGLLILSLKPQLLLLPVILLVLQRRYRELLIAAAAGVVLLAAALAATGPNVPADYVRLLWASAHWENQNGVSPYGMFGWIGLVSDLFGGTLGTWGHLLVTGLDLCTYALVLWLILRGQRRRADPAVSLSLAILGGLLTSPHFYAQDLALLVPVLWIVYARRLASDGATGALALGGWFIPYVHFKLLQLTPLNVTTFYMLGLFVLLAGNVDRRLTSRQAPSQTPAPVRRRV
jgi:Glycosyltransferase family 87